MKQAHTIRKAAILIASLDEPTAKALLKQMGPAQAAKVRQAIEQLEDVDPREQQDVIEEFRRVGPLVPDRAPPGLELDTSLARKLAQSHAAQESPEASSDMPPFRFLHEAEAQSLLPMLEREHPQTIAVVVSHLPPKRAADVLSRLPSSLQGEVVRRLGDLDETDPEILRDVERTFEKFISEQVRGNRRRAAGLETIAAILGAADDKMRHQILSNLAGLDRPLARRLGGDHVISPNAPAPRVLESQQLAPPPAVKQPEIRVERPQCTFEQLMARKDPAIVAVVRAAGTELSALALAGATPQFVERVAGRLGRREAKLLRKALANLGPTRLRDVEQAQQELANVSLTFDDKGRRVGPKPQLLAVA